MRSPRKCQSNNYPQKHKMRDEIYSSLTKAYSSKYDKIVSHYYNEDRYVPIWAVFEIITLGAFGSFVDNLHPRIKETISAELKLPKYCNTNGSLLPYIIFVLRDLRNAVAHNNVIYDGRYRRHSAKNALVQCLSKETNVRDITFESFFDDVVLIVYLQKQLRFKKKPILSFIREIEFAIRELYERLGPSLYMSIIPNNSLNKLKDIEKYLKLK